MQHSVTNHCALSSTDYGSAFVSVSISISLISPSGLGYSLPNPCLFCFLFAPYVSVYLCVL